MRLKLNGEISTCQIWNPRKVQIQINHKARNGSFINKFIFLLGIFHPPFAPNENPLP